MIETPEPHHFWQSIDPADPASPATDFQHAYPARLPDGRQLRLPIRPLANGQNALASLIINQASFEVQDRLADHLAERLRALEPDIIVGLPTLGLTLASAVARALGHRRYVPLGTSRKFWYEEQLSVPLTSITTPEQSKRLYIDPRMLPLLKDRRVALIDDVISSGTSIVSGMKLLELCGVTPVAVGAAMLQTKRWVTSLADAGLEDASPVIGVFETPMLARTAQGLWSASPA